jgi:hypothetical protein
MFKKKIKKKLIDFFKENKNHPPKSQIMSLKDIEISQKWISNIDKKKYINLFMKTFCKKGLNFEEIMKHLSLLVQQIFKVADIM